MRRHFAVLSLVGALVIPSAGLAQSPSPGALPVGSMPVASPVQSLQAYAVPDGYQLVVNPDPQFAFLLPTDWTADPEPREGTTYSWSGPGVLDGFVGVNVHRSGTALKSYKQWISSQKKRAAKDADIGIKVVYSGVLDFLPAGPVADVETVMDYFITNHMDRYLYKVDPELALELKFDWLHAGWDPLWFTVRDSFNPVGLQPPAGYDATAAADTAAHADISDDCKGSIQDLYDALFDLDGRLDVGLVIGDYRTKVGDASVAYNRVDFANMEQPCSLLIGQPLERALNLYIASENQWSRCISSFKCRTSKIKDDLQRRWSGATAILSDLDATFSMN